MAAEPSTTYQGFAIANARDLVTTHKSQLKAIDVTNINAAIRFFQLWDRNAALTGGEVGTGPTPYGAAVPASAAAQLRVISFMIPAGSATAPARLTLDENWLAGVEYFDLGIAWGFSSAAQTYTAGTAADHSVTLRFRHA